MWTSLPESVAPESTAPAASAGSAQLADAIAVVTRPDQVVATEPTEVSESTPLREPLVVPERLAHPAATVGSVPEVVTGLAGALGELSARALPAVVDDPVQPTVATLQRPVDAVLAAVTPLADEIVYPVTDAVVQPVLEAAEPLTTGVVAPLLDQVVVPPVDQVVVPPVDQVVVRPVDQVVAPVASGLPAVLGALTDTAREPQITAATPNSVDTVDASPVGQTARIAQGPVAAVVPVAGKLAGGPGLPAAAIAAGRAPSPAAPPGWMPSPPPPPATQQRADSSGDSGQPWPSTAPQTTDPHPDSGGSSFAEDINGTGLVMSIVLPPG